MKYKHDTSVIGFAPYSMNRIATKPSLMQRLRRLFK